LRVEHASVRAAQDKKARRQSSGTGAAMRCGDTRCPVDLAEDYRQRLKA